MTKWSFKKKVLPSVMAATLASGMTFVGDANAIKLADDGLGQTLLGPLYLADFGYTTKVAVVNTRLDVAVKAKVVIRSSVNCTELLDFICYLTPGDVCRFEIRQQDVNGDGTAEVVMYSDDDSVKSPVPSDVGGLKLVDSLEKSRATFGSIRPVVQPLFTHNLQPNDTTKMGHIEVFGLYGVKGTLTGYRPRISGANREPIPVSITVTRGMAKFALAQIFDTPRYLEHNNSNLFWQPIVSLDEANPPTEQQERNAGPEAPYSPLTDSYIRSTDPTWIQMKGDIELVSSIDRIGFRMPALAGSLGDHVPFPYTTPSGLPGDAGVWDGLVISNPRWDATIAGETGIGVGFGIDSFGNRADKTVEIEAALATTDIVGRFEDTSKTTPDTADTGKRTRILVTFPTRYRHNPGINPCGAGGSGYSAPFQANGAINYTLTGYNNFEELPGLAQVPAPIITGTPFSGGPTTVVTPPPTPTTPVGSLVEVNYFIPNWPETQLGTNGFVLPGTKDFRSGWFSMTFTAATGCEAYYPGAAVVSFTHKYVDIGAGFTQSWFMPTAHKPVRECDDMGATNSCAGMYW
ncbi:MAG TPA: hypothetical protein ENI48_03640 [Thioploca sp.]|nr:hypothetical protein [Thioploca sp.]